MRLSRSALFEAGKIYCKYLQVDSVTKSVTLHDAVAVFVTETTVTASRNIEASYGLHESEIRKQDLNLGDIFVAWVDQSGRQSGFIVPNGGDAGIALQIEVNGVSHVVPFTGVNAYKARKLILDKTGSDCPPDMNQLRALASIDELFSLSLASPDTDRFCSTLKGMALRSLLELEHGSIFTELSDAQLGDTYTAMFLKNEIARVCGEIPEHIVMAISHRELLNDIGIEDGGSKTGLRHSFQNILGGLTRSQSQSFSEKSSNAIRTCLPSIAHVPFNDVSSSIISHQDARLFQEFMSEHELRGIWVDNFQDIAASHGLTGDIRAFTRGERDFILVCPHDNSGSEPGLVLSWPKPCRALLSPYPEIGCVLNLSERDVPGKGDLNNLKSALQAAIREVRSVPEGNF